MPENKDLFQPFEISGITGMDPDTSLNIATHLDPMQEARLKDLSARSGFDVEVLRGLNPADLRPIESNPESFMKSNAMRQYFSEPSRAAISYDDAESLDLVDGNFSAWSQTKYGALAREALEEAVKDAPRVGGTLGIATTDLGNKGSEMMRRIWRGENLSDADVAYVESLSEQLEAEQKKKESMALPGRIVAESSYLAGMMGALTVQNAPEIAAGTAGAATGIIVAGGANPLGMTAVALAQVGAAAFSASSGAVTAKSVYNLEAGNAFVELRRMKDELGQPISPQTAAAAAHVVGVLNTGLEIAGMRALSKIPGIGKYFGAMSGMDIREGMKLALRDPGFRARMISVGKDIAAASGGEITTEVLQDIPGMVLGYAAKVIENREGGKAFRLPENTIGTDENAIINLPQLFETGYSTALGTLGLGTLGGIRTAFELNSEAVAAQKKAEAFNMIRSSLQESKTSGRSVQAVKEFVDTLVANAPESETLYVDGQEALELFQKDGTVFNKLGITESEIVTAAAAGDALEVKTSKVLGDLLDPALNSQFAAFSGILKVAPGAFSKNQADALQTPEAAARALELFQASSDEQGAVMKGVEAFGKSLDKSGFTQEEKARIVSAVDRFAYRMAADGRPLEEIARVWERTRVQISDQDTGQVIELDVNPAPFTVEGAEVSPETPAGKPGKIRLVSKEEALKSSPVLSFVKKAGGIVPKSKAKTKGGEYDDAPTLAEMGEFGRDVYRGRKEKADRMAQQLFDAGLIPDSYPSTMWAAIRKEINSTRSTREAQKREGAQAELVSKWEREDSKQISVSSLIVGDSYTVQGEQFTVTEETDQAVKVVDSKGVETWLPLIDAGGVAGVVRVDKAGPVQAELKQSERLDREFFQTRNEGFYSTLENFIVGSDFKNISSTDLLKRIEGAYQKGTVKKEEVDDIGLLDWLTGLDGARVTKEQVTAFVQERGPRVEEVDRDRENLNLPSKWVFEFEGEFYEFRDEESALSKKADFVSRLVQEDTDNISEEYRINEQGGRFSLEKYIGFRDGVETWFNAFQFDTKQDAELKLQEQIEKHYSQYIDIGEESAAALGISQQTLDELSIDKGTNRRNILFRLPGRDDLVGNTVSHWGEQQGKGVVGHARVSDYTDENGKKVLFVDEIQSDWHQAGREEGYGAEGVPVAPFARSWHMMIFKRILRMAVAGGYDSVAWTGGRQQADRYNLRKYIDRLDVQKAPRNEYAIVVWKKDGTNGAGTQQVTAGELPGLLGKELADKVLAQEEREKSYSGLDLEFGGEGMLKFYDRDLVKDIEKYVKPWGVKEQAITVEEQNKQYSAHRIELTDKLRSGVQSGQALYQPGDNTGNKRYLGSTKVTKDGYIINLFSGQYDESTVLHELGHVFFLETQSWVATGNASKQTMQDWVSIISWLGLPKGTTLSIDQHRAEFEKFAVGFELYLREGRAPSIELESAFEMFKRWLRKVYKTVKDVWTRAGQKVELNPEIRRVFDRMLATDEEIEAAATRDSLLIPDSDLDALGVSPKDKAYIKGLLDKAREQGKARYDRRLAREETARKKEWVDLAKEQIAGERVYRALDRIRKEGLDSAGVVAAVGEEGKKLVSRLGVGIVRKEGGADPEQIAAEYGYDSAYDMLGEMFSAPSKSERLRQIVDEKMTGLEVEKTPEEELLEAAETEEYISAIGNQLLKKVSPARMVRSQDTHLHQNIISRTAERKLGEMPLREAVRFDKFLAAFRSATRKTRDAIGKKDLVAALQHNAQARLQLELMKQSRRIRDRLESRIARVKKAIKSPSIDLDYLYNLINTAARFGLSSKEIPYDNTRRTLAQLLTPDDDTGMDAPPVFSNDLVDPNISGNARQNYRDLATDKAMELFDLLDYLEGIGRRLLKGELLTDQRTREEMAAELTASMPDIKAKVYEKNSLFRVLSDAARDYFASNRVLQFIFRAADGMEKMGKHTALFWNRLQEGYNTKTNRLDAILEQIRPSLDYLAERKKTWDATKLNLPPVPDLMKKDGRTWQWENVLGIALHRGNSYNHSAMMQGYGLTTGDINTILGNLSVDDWVHIQNLWDAVESLWPDLKKTYEDVQIVAPKKVSADPFAVTTSDGVYRLIRGGYFPITFDPALSMRVEEWTEKDNILNALNASFPNPNVPTGYMQARKGSGGLPVQMDYRYALLRHLDFATSYIGMARILKDIDSVTRSRVYTSAFIDRFGQQFYKQIRPALVFIARGATKSYDQLEGLIRNVGAMGSAAAMFGRASTILKQFFDTGSLAGEIGIRNLQKGISTMLKNPVQGIRFIEESSPTMRARWRSHYAGIDEAVLQSWIDKNYGSKLVSGARELFAMPFHIMDMINTSSAWMGAYQSHLAENLDHDAAVHFADNAISAAAPANRPQDLAAFQRDASAFKILFAPFNSWRIKFQNRIMTTTEGVINGQVPIKDAGWMAFVEIFYPVLGWYLLQGLIRAFPGAPEPEERDPADIFFDVARSVTGAFPIVGDAAQGILELVGKKKSRGQYEPPAIKAVKDVIDATSDIFTPTGEFEEETEGMFAVKRRLWGLAGAASIVLRVPATRLYTDLTEGIRQYEMTGKPGYVILPDPELRRQK